MQGEKRRNGKGREGHTVWQRSRGEGKTAPGPSLTAISLGGGVQSTVLALMAAAGEFDRVPDCAIFADTKWEPPSISTHLRWLAEQASFPLYVVDNGRNLREDTRALTNHSDSPNYVDIPVYLKGRSGQPDGIGRRQCTQHYKIRELLGVKTRQRVPAGTTVELWLGISTDEPMRMRDSRDRWIRNRYPLIEAGMSRRDCLDWWEARYASPLERPACVACPFQSRRRWVETKRRWPQLFAEAVADRHQATGRAGVRQGAILPLPENALGRGCSSRRGAVGSRRAGGRVRE